jgi:hypothetical protein
MIKDWSDLAFNQVPDSDNRIHSDEIAQAYGFVGALVPGVTVSSYLLHPAVEAWGMEWLQRGWAHVKILSPLYDRNRFDVITSATEKSYTAELFSQQTLCAIAEVKLPDAATSCPEYKGDELISSEYDAPAANRQSMENLKIFGCPAMEFLWDEDCQMAAYVRDQSAMPALLRTDHGADSHGYANPAYLLGVANRHFAAVARMSPWVHLETRSRNFQALPLNTELISEMRIVDLFNKKGHEFADCTFNLFRKDTQEALCSIEQRAIYQMRPV